MYAILSQTKETIALKKKQIEENQIAVNHNAINMAEMVKRIQHLDVEVDLLETELYRLEKQVAADEQRKRDGSENGCSISAGPSSIPFPGDSCTKGSTESNRSRRY
jgi:hypothetical protein